MSPNSADMPNLWSSSPFTKIIIIQNIVHYFLYKRSLIKISHFLATSYFISMKSSGWSSPYWFSYSFMFRISSSKGKPTSHLVSKGFESPKNAGVNLWVKWRVGSEMILYIFGYEVGFGGVKSYIIGLIRKVFISSLLSLSKIAFTLLFLAATYSFLVETFFKLSLLNIKI